MYDADNLEMRFELRLRTLYCSLVCVTVTWAVWLS